MSYLSPVSFFLYPFGMLFTVILHASVWWDYATWVCLVFFSFLVPLHVNKRAFLSSMRTTLRPPSRLPRLWGNQVVVLSPSLPRCAPGGSVSLDALFSSVFFGNIDIRECSEGWFKVACAVEVLNQVGDVLLAC
ncbi:hypothetical protein DFS33DRAFT_853529 [Desarmillaria ectypa]|nr:hypothetical protein DFS33DRAFT_853529 [Desarmillaria ectypa]